MKTVIISLVTLILSIMNISGQGARHDRQPAVAGSFYPAGSDKIRTDLNTYFSTCNGPVKGTVVRAIIAPHAGYVYSGHTAAAAFAAISPDAVYDNIFLIGTSHRYAYEGAAVFTSGDMITPLGTVKVNSEIGEKLIKSNNSFIRKDEAHIPEHSLEVQLPFIQYHFKNSAPVIPILIGTRNKNVLREIASELKPYFTEKNLFVISSDFSHYPSYDDAKNVDNLTAKAILTGNPDQFVRAVNNAETSGIDNLATAMCGWPGGLVLMYLTEGNDNLKYRLAEYRNSGDSPYGSKDEVVGYNAIVVEQNSTQSKPEEKTEDFTLTAAEKKTLLEIARNAISSRIYNTPQKKVDPSKLTPRLKEPLGAFVTITIDGNLRGCIGRFTSPDPLYEVVASMAQESAFGDPRFPDLSASEYPGIHIEISVLGPMRKINDISEIKLGKHGIYIKKGMAAGTLLPQVATDRGWTVQEFLGYCARDKAGIGWDGWKTADIYVYEAYVFGE